LKRKSSNFRQQARRIQRRVAEAGGAFRISRTTDELQADLTFFFALHRARWGAQGDSVILRPEVEKFLRDAAPRMLSRDRLRLWSLEIDGRPISSHLFLASGRQVAYFNGGFDPAWASLRPGLATLLAAVADACERGDEVLDLGGGDQAYKRRLGDVDRPITWKTVFPRNATYPFARASMAPSHALWRLRHELRSRVDFEARQRLKRALRARRSS
jgi:CelD/BcsL family acetyltransferase involved in cellulose biosynthesis